MAGSLRVIFSREHPEKQIRSSLRKKLAFIHRVMTGWEAKTVITDRNYIQVQRDDYASGSDAEGSGNGLVVTKNTLACDISISAF